MTWTWPLLVSAGPADVAAAEVVEIAAGVYVRPGRTAMLFEADDVANAGFIVGERCVAVIDTGGSVAEGRALAAAIRRTTAVEVCFVINTHVHPDHMLGNAAFQRHGAEFIGHETLSQAMAMRGEIYLQRAAEFTGEAADMLQIIPPERVVSRTVQLDLGRRMLTERFSHVVPGHGPARVDWPGRRLFAQ